MLMMRAEMGRNLSEGRPEWCGLKQERGGKETGSTSLGPPL
jgi:hypothetical protein